MYYYCPHCNQKYDVSNEYIGKSITCQYCSKPFIISNASAKTQRLKPIESRIKTIHEPLITRIWKWNGYGHLIIGAFAMLFLIGFIARYLSLSPSDSWSYLRSRSEILQGLFWSSIILVESIGSSILSFTIHWILKYLHTISINTNLEMR